MADENNKNPQRKADIRELLKEKILLLDGGMGTCLHTFNLTAKDFGGDKYEGCNEHLNLTRPDIITSIHETYLKAGADIIETNSFAGSAITLAEFGLEDKDHEINFAAARLAKECVEKFSTDTWPRFVAGSLGPTNKTISISANITFDELENAYYKQAKALAEGGADIFLVETSFDTLNAKAALIAIQKLNAEIKDERENKDEIKKELPVFLSATIERNGTMLAGQDIEAFYTSVEHFKLAAIGMNCATGPDLMTDHIRTLSGIAKTNTICYPNAGLPLEDGTFPLKPREFAMQIKEFAEKRWVNIVGGCCGTTPEHIAEIRKVLDADKRNYGHKRIMPDVSRTAVSGTECIVAEDDNRPLIVGERTNVIGSRKFKELICAENFEIAAEVGKTQVKTGAQILDVCLANPDREESDDTSKFYDLITKKVKVPLMIDSTDPKVIEIALKRSQGKCIINSLNFEDGTERIEKVMPLVKKYGAALIFGTIDEDKEQAMATTVEKKLEIAKRAYNYLTEEWGFSGHDIIFDLLVFPIATGDAKYSNSAKVTIDAIRKIKKELPSAKTILGVSNVSFGLPPAGRETLNSVYLYHATKAGLDFAIVNSEKLIRYPSIPENERKLAEDLLYQQGDDPVTPFVEFYRSKKSDAFAKTSAASLKNLPLNERLARYIVEGTKEYLVEDLNEALKKSQPLDIINGPLMAGMDEVGKLFNDNKLIVSEVLQSAEAMKAAVAHLEKFMEKQDDDDNDDDKHGVRRKLGKGKKSDGKENGKGRKSAKVILATVKGDVHDIGKNLLEIILHNNGYKVINLGIKVAPEQLIEAYHEHKPDIIGLSGLLVKSAHMMVTTCEDLKKAGINIPIFVGGAALTIKFTAGKIAPAYSNAIDIDQNNSQNNSTNIVVYSKDAMEGLTNVKEITNDFEKFRNKNDEVHKKALAASIVAEHKVSGEQIEETERSPAIQDAEILRPQDFEEHIIEDYDLKEIFDYINPVMLYTKHLGLRGAYSRLIENKDEKALKLTKQVDEVKEYIIKNKIFQPRAIYRFFECNADKNKILIYDDENLIEVLGFPRQKTGEKLCASDFVAQKREKKENDTRGKESDTIGFFVTTCGHGVMEKAKELRENGEYLKSHILQVLAIEGAEAFAEIVHKKMREFWGIVDKQLTKNEVFQAKYHGIRLSYGYPACPDLNEQRKLFKLLKPQKIGVNLTEGMMMEPEASVSAVVFHHPQAKYFNV